MKYEKVRLGEVAEIQGGYAFKTGDFRTKGIPVIKIGNIQDRKVVIDESTVYVSVDFLEKCKNFIINKGEVLIALSGATTGKIGIYDGTDKVLLNQRVGRIKPNKYKIDTKYIYFYINTIKNSILQKAGGVAQPNISPQDISNFQIPLPPLEIQKKIADILDKAREVIDKRKEQIEQMDELLKSTFLDMFGDPVSNPKGWEVDILFNHVKILGGGTPNTKIEEYYENGNILWVSPKDMKFDFITNSIDKITENAVKNSSVKEIPINSVLMVIRSGILKNKLPVAINKKIVTVNQDMKAFLPKQNLNCMFLLYLFKLMEKKILGNVRGTTADNINSDIIKNLDTILPPISLQNQFAVIVEKAEAEREKMENSLKEMEQNFEALMQRAFNGELFN